jgi:hypothetical protein
MVLLVVLKGEKVYKIPIRSEIELDHLKDFNTLRRILTPLVQLYHGVGFDTRLTYDEFSIFINDLQHLGYERLDEYSSGIQELVEAKPITENNQDVEKIRKGLLISLKSQELSEVLATKIKQAIHEVFENEKKKGGRTNEQGTLFRTYGEFNYKRGSIFANSPITLIIERQSNPLPFIACTHPQPP